VPLKVDPFARENVGITWFVAFPTSQSLSEPRMMIVSFEVRKLTIDCSTFQNYICNDVNIL
jgi:hypothetical protein